MLLIPCPWCGPRAELEFSYGGEAGLRRDTPEIADFLYLRTNQRGPYDERWRHVHGCGRYFHVRRDTGNDRILAVWRIGEAVPS